MFISEAYLDAEGRPLLLDYARAESESGARTVEENEDWIAVVPYWATWPYELLVMPKRRLISHFDRLEQTEKRNLASLLKPMLTRYDNLFETHHFRTRWGGMGDRCHPN